MQAESWFLGLRAVISRSHHKRFLGNPKSRRGAQSCVSSPASYIRRRQNLGLYPMDSTRLSKVLAALPDWFPYFLRAQIFLVEGLDAQEKKISFYPNEKCLTRIQLENELLVIIGVK